MRLNHGSRPRSRPSAFIFARLVASCAEINSPLPLISPLQRSSRAQTPTECPISKGSCRILHLVLPLLPLPFRSVSVTTPSLATFRNQVARPTRAGVGAIGIRDRCWDLRKILIFFFFESIQGGIRKFFD